MDYRDDTGAAAGDVALMLRVRAGDESAYAVIYDRYHRKLLDFFFAMSRDRHAAQDLTHETFLRVWKARKRYAATGSFVAYLFSFARYVWLEQCRELRKRRGLEAGLDEDAEARAVAPDAGPCEMAERSEMARAVARAVDALPEDQRMAFVLRVVEGMPIEQIAAIMECPVNTVRSRKILALRKLRETLRYLVSF